MLNNFCCSCLCTFTLRDKTIELRSQNSATKVEQNFGKPNLEFAPQKWRKTLKTKIELGRKPYFRMCTTPFLPELSILPIYISVRSIFLAGNQLYELKTHRRG